MQGAVQAGRKRAVHPLLRAIAQRLALGLLTLWLVSILIFLAVDLLPGDFASAILGQSATAETVAAFQKSIGLDRPLLPRYIDWVKGVLVGDFGTSFSSSAENPRLVSDLIGPRIVNTFILAGTTALIAVPLSLILGIVVFITRLRRENLGANPKRLA